LLALGLIAGSASPAEPPAPRGGCRPLASPAQIIRVAASRGHGDEGATVVVYGVAFDAPPTVGSKALVVPGRRVKPVRLAVVAAERAEVPAPIWNVTLKAAGDSALAELDARDPARPEYLGAAVVIWPPPEGTVGWIEAASAEPPPDVAEETIGAAIDLDGDRRADALVVEFCCGDRRRATECEYSCGEVWSRNEDDDDAWVRCHAWGPA
jgi:hypothetical protein